MAKNIRHIGIVVKNLKESLRFYRECLGFDIVKQMEESGPYIEKLLDLPDAAVTTVKMALSGSGSMIELIHFHLPAVGQRSPRLNDCGPTHFSLTVDNIDTEYARLREAGVAFISSPKVSPDGYAKVAFCRAPEGTLIELVEVLAPRKGASS